MVKLSAASDVTDSTGLAVPASELNAAMEGSLANKIANLNNKAYVKVLANRVPCTQRTNIPSEFLKYPILVKVEIRGQSYYISTGILPPSGRYCTMTGYHRHSGWTNAFGTIDNGSFVIEHAFENDADVTASSCYSIYAYVS